MDYPIMPETPEPPRQDDFGSLLSMLRYAREEAARHRLELETYFLDMAIMSLAGRIGPPGPGMTGPGVTGTA